MHMLRINWYKFFLVAISAQLLLVTGSIFAQNESGDLFSLDIESLMNIEVVSAAKKAQRIGEAPAVMSVLTREDIKNLAVNTLIDAVGYVTGVTSYNTYHGVGPITIRGTVQTEHFNSKILFLLNGHPVSNPVQDAFELDSVPIDAVDRVEFIRGPVSVLYGTRALIGVINIVTRTDYKDGLYQANYRYGSFDTHEARLTAGDRAGDVDFFAASTLRNRKGFLLEVEPDQDEAGMGFTQRQGQESASIFATIGYGDFDFDYNFSYREFPRVIGLLPNSNFRSEWEQLGHRFDLRHEYQMSAELTITSKLRFDIEEFDRFISNLRFIDPGIPGNVSSNSNLSKKYGAEFYANWEPNEDLDMIIGVQYDRYKIR